MNINFLLKFITLCFFVNQSVMASLSISCGFRAPQTTFYQAVYTEAFSRIGETLKFYELPAERSIQMANTGIMDGECSRAPKAVAKYTNLVKVPEKVWDIKFTSFVKSKAITIKTWDDLRPYHVATVAGYKMAENKIPKVNPRSFTILPNVTTLFKMLEAGRIDVAVLTDLIGRTKLDELNIKEVKIQTPALTEVPLYLMLNKEHTHLAEPLRKALSDMKADGTWQRIFNQLIDKKGL